MPSSSGSSVEAPRQKIDRVTFAAREVVGRNPVPKSRLAGRLVQGRKPVAVLRGRVIRGEGWGRTIGYPTVNLFPLHRRRVRDGVYIALVGVGRKRYHGLAVIGVRGRNGQPKVEAHLLDFRRNLYGRSITISLLKRIRLIRSFRTNSALLRAIERDVRQARRYFKTLEGRRRHQRA